MKHLLIVPALLIFLASCTQTPASRNTITMPSDDTQMMQSGSMMSGAMMQKNESMMKQGSAYRNYTPDLMNSALRSGQKVTLFFAASWCPSCRALEKTILADIGSIPADTVIIKVNYDDSTELKKKYGVVTQHTTVVLNADGTAKSMKIGARTVAEALGN